jgi:hypothetical protein
MKAEHDEAQTLRDVRTLPMATRAKLNLGSAVFQPPDHDIVSWSRSSKAALIWDFFWLDGDPEDLSCNAEKYYGATACGCQGSALWEGAFRHFVGLQFRRVNLFVDGAEQFRDDVLL